MSFLKNRPHGKKMGIILLAALIIIALAEIIFRATVIGEAVLTTANLGEQLAVIALAVTILILNAKGKDRACYICYGAWIGYFVLDQLFELPSIILDATVVASTGFDLVLFAPVLHAVSAICIIAIGAILVEYMTDGTICNRAFNILCTIAILAILGCIIVNVISLVNGLPIEVLLVTFNNISRIAMLFLFAFFAYDSAKMQLEKSELTK